MRFGDDRKTGTDAQNDFPQLPLWYDPLALIQRSKNYLVRGGIPISAFKKGRIFKAFTFKFAWERGDSQAPQLEREVLYVPHGWLTRSSNSDTTT
jgi:hypothetical protein